MAISQDALSSTLRILVAKEVDSTYKAIPIWDAIKTAGNLELTDGGSRVDLPVVLDDHSSITQLSSGYEGISMAVKDIIKNATFEWCDFTAPVVITKKDSLTNSGPRAIVKIVETRLKQVMGALRREASKQMLAGNSTILTELQTFNGDSAVGSTGWLEPIAYGSQVNTVGGIAKTAYPLTWQNQFKNAGGTLAISEMQDLLIACATRAPEGAVDIILLSPLCYGAYRSLLTANERYASIKEMTDMSGRMALQFGAAPVYITPDLEGVTTTVAGPSTVNLSGYFLNSKAFYLYSHKDAYFQTDDMVEIPGYATSATKINARLQLACANLSGQGVLCNVTG